SYASLWLMAPGESIIAPEVAWGASAYAYWSGTSMSTPEVAGAVALLDAAWPILKTNGGAPAILFASATDLGAKGVDSTFGNGLLNIAKAFQPVGTLSVGTVTGASVPVSSPPGSTVAGSAFGTMPALKGLLSHYTAFDAYRRNFTVNLSGMITSQSTLPQALASQAAPINAATRTLANGAHLTVAFSDLSHYDLASATPGLQLTELGAAPREAGAFYLSLTTAGGSVVSAGRGLPSTASFANAMWGEGSADAYQADQLGVSNSLMGLAQGGLFASLGTSITPRARIAASWTSTPTPSVWNLAMNNSQRQSSAFTVGMSYKVTARLSGGVTISSLDERNGLLGSVYSQGGPLGLGSEHRSASAAATWSYDLGGGRGLLIDGVLAKTSGAAVNSGLVASVSPIVERAYGASIVQADAFRYGDRLSLSVTKPLKVIGGSAQVLTAGVNDQGYPVYNFARADLRPNGDETDFGVGYRAALHGGMALSTALDYRAQAYNVSGLDDVRARVSFSMGF
ncbi:MAG: S8 family serine peptidase, partial [Caulobacterales bacterium]